MLTKVYAPLLKTEEQDDGTLRISGIASTESVDAVGEVVTAAAMKAALPDFFRYGTGALREMHGLSAAGTVDVADVGDDNVTVIEATVVDEQAIKKCLKGVYKGLSIGGKVAARDKANKKIITKINLVEISLVDRPCNPDAVFDIWKAETAEGNPMDPETEGAAAPETVTAPVAAPVAAPAAPVETEVAKAEPAAPEAPAAPVAETAAAVEPPTAAPETAAKADAAPAAAVAPSEPAAAASAPPAAPEAAPAADGAPQATAKAEATAEATPTPLARALAAVEALGAAVTKAAGGEDLAKGLYTVRTFAEVLSSIAYMVSDLKSEAEFEGDNSPVPGKLQAWLLAGVPLFKEMAAEEIDELVARVTAQKAEGATALSAAAEADALAKAQATVADETAALKAQIAERETALSKLADSVEPLTATVNELAKRLAVVEAQPAPAKTAGSLAKVAPTPVSKEQDVAGHTTGASAAVELTDDAVRKALEAMSPAERAGMLMKAALAMPQRIGA